MSETNDWLDITPPDISIDKALVKANPQYQAMVEAFARLSPRQRIFVRALPSVNFVPATLIGRLEGVSERTIYRWNTDPDVKHAIAIQRELAAEFAGIDALSVMLRVSAWAAYCEELVPICDNNGRPMLDAEGSPMLKKRDISNGLKALELLGKHTGALAQEHAPTQAAPTGPGLSITYIHNAAPQTVAVGRVIDAEVINIPTPMEKLK